VLLLLPLLHRPAPAHPPPALSVASRRMLHLSTAAEAAKAAEAAGSGRLRERGAKLWGGFGMQLSAVV